MRLSFSRTLTRTSWGIWHISSKTKHTYFLWSWTRIMMSVSAPNPVIYFCTWRNKRRDDRGAGSYATNERHHNDEWFVHKRKCVCGAVGLNWEKLVGVPIDGCKSVMENNVGLLKQMQDKGTEIRPRTETDIFALFHSSSDFQVSAEKQLCCWFYSYND